MSMRRSTIRPGSSVAFLAILGFLLASDARAHFLWLRIVAESASPGRSSICAFLGEEPERGGTAFLEHVRGMVATVDGYPIEWTESRGELTAHWLGRLPHAVEASRDMGLKTRNDVTYRLFYTARAQVGIADEERCIGNALRTRVVRIDGQDLLEVRFEQQPVPGARVRIYRAGEEPTELTTDATGHLIVPGLATGDRAVWATYVDPVPGQCDGVAFRETRYYSSLTYSPRADDAAVTRYAELPGPAINSFGGAVLGDSLYVYGGHLGRMHHYTVDTTAKSFRRFDLLGRTTSEELPMQEDVQGVALVSDGKFLYRTGGMRARNAEGEDEDTFSVASAARFDPDANRWSDLPALPEPRSTHDAIVRDGKLWIFGGWTLKGRDTDAEYCTTALALDLAHPESGWTTIEQPFRRRALAVAEFQGKLYVLGGLTSESRVAKRVDVFDPRTSTWSAGPELPGFAKHEGFGPSAFTVDGQLFYCGASGYLFSLAEDGSRWRVRGALAEPRITHRLLPGPESRPGSLIVVGGNVDGEQTTRIESFDLSARNDGS